VDGEQHIGAPRVLDRWHSLEADGRERVAEKRMSLSGFTKTPTPGL
jgi:hypothetical protein